ncbi:biopolymer transporter ExbD [Ectothiorhodospiraceae bacterium 2226]|nr:biopolymer transporter ExbD [Ectothiorhodospiraceae bacterium 2226]
MQFEGRRRIRTHLDMAPLIDVVFLLLVFFLLTSTFMVQEAVELRLPSATTAAPVERQPLHVAVTEAGEPHVDGEVLSLQALEALVRARVAEDPELAVMLQADARLSVQGIMDVMDRLRAGGARRLGVATVRAR